ILAARAAGADLAYVGSAFLAAEESRAPEDYKQMIVDSSAGDIVYSNLFTGIHRNYLRGSIEAAGLDPDDLPESDPSAMDFGACASTGPARHLGARLRTEYADAGAALGEFAPAAHCPGVAEVRDPHLAHRAGGQRHRTRPPVRQIDRLLLACHASADLP